jgi:hypothetical protein
MAAMKDLLASIYYGLGIILSLLGIFKHARSERTMSSSSPTQPIKNMVPRWILIAVAIYCIAGMILTLWISRQSSNKVAALENEKWQEVPVTNLVSCITHNFG